MYFGINDIEILLRESEKHDLLIITASEIEAREAAEQFKRVAENRVVFTANRRTLKVLGGNKKIRFVGIGLIQRSMDGYRGRVIIHLPVLEYTSERFGHACTMRQMQNEEMQQDIRKQDIDALQNRINELEKDNSRLRNEMSYMINPCAIGDRQEMGG